MGTKKRNSTEKTAQKPDKVSVPTIPKSKDKEVDYTKPLENSKYERFCQEYIKDNNAAQSAIRAGYSENGADSRGSQLLVIVSIKNRIAILQLEISRGSRVDAKMVIEGFRKIAFGTITKELTNKNKLRALENLGKHLGIFEKDNIQRGFTLKIG